MELCVRSAIMIDFSCASRPEGGEIALEDSSHVRAKVGQVNLARRRFNILELSLAKLHTVIIHRIGNFTLYRYRGRISSMYRLWARIGSRMVLY